MKLRNSIPRFKSLAIEELSHIQDVMRLLMKRRNGLHWTRDERVALRKHLRRAAGTLPVLGLFTLPLGGLLLAALAVFLDRRRQGDRSGPASAAAKVGSTAAESALENQKADH